MNIFDTIIYEPIFNTVLFVHKILPGQDMGVTIIVVTLLIKGLLYSPSLAAIKASRQLSSLQPKLKALQEKYKNNKEELARQQMQLYRESKVNPLSSCLPILVQIPVFIGLFRVFLNGLNVDSTGILPDAQLAHVYPALRGYYETHALTTTMFGWIDLAKNHNIILALLAGAAQFWQSRMLAAPKEPKTPEAKDEAITSSINRQMAYVFPVITAYFSYSFPAGLALYWFVSTGFQVAQQYLFLKRHPIKKNDSAPEISANAGQPS